MYENIGCQECSLLAAAVISGLASHAGTDHQINFLFSPIFDPLMLHLMYSSCMDYVIMSASAFAGSHDQALPRVFFINPAFKQCVETTVHVRHHG